MSGSKGFDKLLGNNLLFFLRFNINLIKILFQRKSY